MRGVLLDDLESALSRAPLGSATHAFSERLRATRPRLQHGDAVQWEAALAALPTRSTATIVLDRPCVTVGSADELSVAERLLLEQSLRRLHPWRKGPFTLFGIDIDSEWRSDWKWARLEKHIAPLRGRCVLDVGCGNGYYAWRMLGAGARFVLGIDPSLRFLAQFAAVQRFVPDADAVVLPIGGEDIPPGLACFDTAFSMGVIYHRRDPLEHLRELHGALKPGGELVLETLVVAGERGHTLHPVDRYAKMRNVWSIPTVDTALEWLDRSGFDNSRVVDITRTTIDEQRSTAWMRFESLAEFLDPGDPALTVEGYPAPTRAIVLARKSC
jgi:tRNA (mo5U34)-methyltransferase